MVARVLACACILSGGASAFHASAPPRTRLAPRQSFAGFEDLVEQFFGGDSQRVMSNSAPPPPRRRPSVVTSPERELQRKAAAAAARTVGSSATEDSPKAAAPAALTCIPQIVGKNNVIRCPKIRRDDEEDH